MSRYKEYKSYLLTQHALAAKFESYDEYEQSNMMLGWTEADFNRYKDKAILEEYEYLTLMSLKNKVSEDMIGKIKF